MSGLGFGVLDPGQGECRVSGSGFGVLDPGQGAHLGDDNAIDGNLCESLYNLVNWDFNDSFNGSVNINGHLRYITLGPWFEV